MTSEERLRKKIREHITRALTEISTTGSIDGYLIPHAFAKDGKGNSNRVRKMAKMIGYTLTKHGEKDAKLVDNLKENYHQFKQDETSSPQKKIANSIKTAREQIELAEKQIKMSLKYQKETGMSGEELWKVTQKQLTKLENRLQKLIEKLRDMRG